MAELVRRGAPGQRDRWTVGYVFCPRPRTTIGRDEGAYLHVALEAALKAGHGAHAGFRLTIERNPASSVRLSVEDPASRRWVERALARAYAPGEWRRAPVRPPPDGAVRWRGRRLGLPGERGADPLAAGSVVRAVDAALAAVGGEAAVEISLRPVPLSRWADWERWLTPGPGPEPADRRTRASGPFLRAPRSEPRRTGPVPLWTAAIDLWQKAAGSASSSSGAPRTVAAASALLDGRGWSFRPERADRAPRFGSLFAEGELLALLPTPDAVPEAGGAAPPPGGGVPIGHGAAGEVVSLPVETEQGRHFALVGETGMGKSSLLVAVASRASRRAGLVLLDPLGETAEALRAELTRGGRRFLWIAPDAPGAGVNALAEIRTAAGREPVRAERELEALVHALRRVRAGRYADSSYWGPRLEEMLTLALRGAAAIPDGTLEDAHALLARLGSGRTVVPLPARAPVEELASRVRDRPEDAEGARRLLAEIVRNPTLFALLCSRAPSMSIPEMVAPGRITVVSGSAAVVGESTARYLLSTYVALLWSELLARGGRAKTFVLLDEAQWFANEGLGEMLRLARRRNVHVGLATQSLASLPEALSEAVRTNVADLVVFRAGPEEARELSRAVPAISAEQLVALPRGEAAALIGKGERVRWVTTARLPEVPADVPRGVGGVGGCVGPEHDDIGPVGVTAAPAEPGAARLLAWIAQRDPGPASGSLLEVRLRDLRELAPADERALRALGGELGRRGAIVRTERGPDGTTWYLERTRLPAETETAAPRTGEATAGSGQRL